MKATYVDHMGSDLSVVNAARVSFGKKSEWVTYDWEQHVDEDSRCVYDIPKFRLSDRDTKLIQFLARGCTTGDWDAILYEIGECCKEREVSDRCELESILRDVKNMSTHWTPFGHTAITLHIKAPIFVARQLGKHQVGMVWNEVSRRYVTEPPEMFWPKDWRKAADNIKQGSSNDVFADADKEDFDGEIDGYLTAQDLDASHQDVFTEAVRTYNFMLDEGVCPEQARMVLPQSMYTEWYWTGNLYSFANVFIQRTDSHAQKEVQEVSRQIGDIIQPLFPVSWEALTK